MKITDRFVVYYDRKNLLLPLKWLSNLLLSRAPKYDGGAAREISLCLPRLMELAKKDSRVMILEWNMFDPWPHEKVDLIKIANVLNRSYFTNGEILAAIENLRRALKPDGRLLVVENRAVEQWSLFAMEGSSLKLVSEGNGGCDISSLVERSGSKN
ncbi:MAG: class I SAM-dependent methyltransferase [Deltaproteobacteria bacterium]|uniref:Class I SAM-dependent methyltransferase n=1 Tax=Candidatus Zymogenus saltonus TaxID=2844893 RepID=A0A9D8PNG3_9DELT|nr:class I SAM-dependent methyltransferase [Candidatus Zymogenus saltonus]